MSKFFYCPICGKTLFQENRICPKCKNYVCPMESIHETNYYREKSTEIFGNPSCARQVLLEEEICKNPFYNPDTTMHNAEEEYNRNIQQIFEPKKGEENVPKCPTCGSTKIKNISTLKRAAHAYAFGIFSKTARSQFECCNCGYKW